MRTLGLLCFSLGVTIASSGHAADILFMQQAANPDFDDQLIEFIEALGHNVTPYDTGTMDPDEQIEEASNHDLVYVTESLGSTTTHDGVETFIKEVETPQIWAEAYAWDEAAMTGDIQFEDFGNTQRANIDEDPVEEFNEGQDSMIIKDPNHPLAGGFSGSVQVYEDLYSLNWGLVETLGAGAEVVATVTEAGEYATLFAYPKGAMLEDETPAAGIRVGFWLGQAGIGAPVFDNLHPNGLALIEAAINYGLGLTGPRVPGDFDGNGELSVADIDMLSAAAAGGTNPAEFDLTGDGMVNADDVRKWIKDPEIGHSYFGDANYDREFNSGDLVSVFQQGLYETGQAATWSQGDWNSDGLFNSGDFVTAFQDGGYELGPLDWPAAAVPEPSSILLLCLGLVTLLRRRR